jgi:hypothetical protein
MFNSLVLSARPFTDETRSISTSLLSDNNIIYSKMPR